MKSLYTFLCMIFSTGIIIFGLGLINFDSYEEICDGINVTTYCSIDGIKYEKYLYHEEKQEVSHQEEKYICNVSVVGHCTICNDNTYSPSCSVGRGTCSHHGGIREKNAPIYNENCYYDYVTVIDSPFVPSYYEKIVRYN